MEKEYEVPLGLKIKQTHIAIEKYIDKHIRSQEIGGMTGMEAFTLVQILQHGPFTATTLRKFTKLSKASTSATLAGLEKKGLIVQVPRGEDKRFKILKVTDKGIEADKVYHAQYDKMEEKLRTGLSQEEIKQLTSLLEKVRSNIQEDEMV